MWGENDESESGVRVWVERERERKGSSGLEIDAGGKKKGCNKEFAGKGRGVITAQQERIGK